METKDEWLTIKEACAYLKVQRQALWRWRQEGKVTLYRLGGNLRVKKSAVDALLRPVDDADIAAQRPDKALAARRRLADQRRRGSEPREAKGGEKA